MAPHVQIDSQALRSAAGRLKQQAPNATTLPDSAERAAKDAERANRGFMTGEAGTSLVEALQGAMEHYKEHIETEADLIEGCADDWDGADEDNKREFESIGPELRGPF